MATRTIPGGPWYTPFILWARGQYLLKGTQLNGLSQANVYGDDCNPATNYPLVRLRNDVTHEFHYCRTYHFSDRAVATGGALQSVHFSVPAGLPHGHYDLCVVANGISSHCIDFGHRHPKHCREHDTESCGCKSGCSCCRQEECRCEENTMHDRDICELRGEMRRLENSIHRLASMIKSEDVWQKKEVTSEREERERDKTKKK